MFHLQLSRIDQGANSKQTEKKVGEFKQKAWGSHRRQVLDENLLVGHNHVTIYRLIKMDLFKI